MIPSLTLPVAVLWSESITPSLLVDQVVKLILGRSPNGLFTHIFNCANLFGIDV